MVVLVDVGRMILERIGYQNVIGLPRQDETVRLDSFCISYNSLATSVFRHIF